MVVLKLNPMLQPVLLLLIGQHRGITWKLISLSAVTDPILVSRESASWDIIPADSGLPITEIFPVGQLLGKDIGALPLPVLDDSLIIS